jgi:hypothetical protein
MHQHLAAHITSVALGAPVAALPLPVAPMAPEPFVPVVSTPVKLITVIEESTARDNVAVTDAPPRGADAKARQISAVPHRAFVLLTRTQVRPPPVTLVTVVLVVVTLSADIKANNSWFPELVAKLGVVTVVPEWLDPSK